MSKLRERAKARPDTFLFYGRPGIGKSELAAQFPAPVFLCDPQEDGVEDLQTMGYVNKDIPIYAFGSSKDYKSSLTDLIKSDYRTVVTETIGGLAKIVMDEVYKHNNYKSWKAFNAFAEGPKLCVPHYREIITHLNDLRDAGKTIVFTGHADVTNKRNARGEDYLIGVPTCEKRCWEEFGKWFKNVFFLEIDFDVDEAEDRGSVNKAADCGERLMFVETNSSFEAKNRYRISEPISMGSTGTECFKNLCEAIKGAKKS